MAEKRGASGRGGVRTGSGRPRSYVNSDRFRADLVRAERASVKAGEPSMAETLVAMAKSNDKRAAAPALKLFYDKVVIPASEQKVETTRVTGPGIYLPEEKPVLASVTPIKADKPAT